jgi:hypothetical protein
MKSTHPIIEKYSDIQSGRYKSYIILADGRFFDVSRLPGFTCHMDGVYYLCRHAPALLGISYDDARRLLALKDSVCSDGLAEKETLIKKVLSFCVLVGEAGDKHVMISCMPDLLERVYTLFQQGRIRLHPSNNLVSINGEDIHKIGLNDFLDIDGIRKKWSIENEGSGSTF